MSLVIVVSIFSALCAMTSPSTRFASYQKLFNCCSVHAIVAVCFVRASLNTGMWNSDQATGGMSPKAPLLREKASIHGSIITIEIDNVALVYILLIYLFMVAWWFGYNYIA